MTFPPRKKKRREKKVGKEYPQYILAGSPGFRKFQFTNPSSPSTKPSGPLPGAWAMMQKPSQLSAQTTDIRQHLAQPSIDADINLHLFPIFAHEHTSPRTKPRARPPSSGLTHVCFDFSRVFPFWFSFFVAFALFLLLLLFFEVLFVLRCRDSFSHLVPREHPS